MDPDLRNAILEAAAFFGRFNKLLSLLEGGHLDQTREKDDALPRTVTRQEAARMLDVSAKTIDRLAKSGKLPKKAFGRSTRFLVSDVMGLVK